MATYYTNWSFSNSSSPNKATYVVDGQNVTYYNDVRYKFVVTESVNKSDNKSTLTVKKYAVFYWTWPESGGSISITMKSKAPNGASYQSETKSVSATSNSSGYVLVGTDSFTITHNSDGSGSTTFTGLGTYTGGSGTVYTRTVSKTISLTKIDRPSTVTSNATSATQFGDSITFTITRKSSSFTHTLTYKMYDASGTIASKMSGTTKAWTIPTSLINSTPKNAKPTITITCETFNGSTSQGKTTYNFSCKVPDSYKPTCSLSLSEANTTVSALNLGKYVQGVSQIHAQITAAGSAGSTITSYSTPANDVIYSNNDFTTSVLKYNGERTITTTVMDSRSRSKSASQNIEIIQYFNPTIMSCKVERCLSNGTLDEEGTYGKATISYKVAPLNDGTSNRNTITIKVYYGSTIYKTYTPSNFEGTYTFPNNNLFSNLPTNANSGFTFVIEDRFHKESSDSAITQSFVLPPSFVTISKLAGGKGITFGRSAGEEGFVNYMNTKLQANTWTKNISVSGLKTEKFTEGSWITYVE